jgi:hypothetical protein
MAAILSLVYPSAKKNHPGLKAFMRFLAGILITVFLPIPAISVDVPVPRGAAKDGGTLG